MAEIYQLPENGGNNGGLGNIPFSIPIGGFGGGFGSMPPMPKLEEKDFETDIENKAE